MKDQKDIPETVAQGSLHVPVMLPEAIDALQLQKGQCVVDATLGGGSYTRALHTAVMPGGRVIAIDEDASAIARLRTAEPALSQDITLVHHNYEAIAQILSDAGRTYVDAIVADLGLSSDQLESAERGFSFLHNGPLDMRLDQTTGPSAADIVNTWSYEDLARILRTYGDERYSVRIAKAIVAARPLMTTGDLSEVVQRAIGTAMRGAKIHPATRTFQAIRIAVNDEYVHLEKFLHDAVGLLVPGGRMSIVSFHSGEDRIVKNVFREEAKSCMCDPHAPVCTCQKTPRLRIVTRKPITPSAEEIARNPRARSAKLRVIEKL